VAERNTTLMAATVYQEQLSAVRQLADERFEGNLSMALRAIIRFYMDAQRAAQPQPQPCAEPVQ